MSEVPIGHAGLLALRGLTDVLSEGPDFSEPRGGCDRGGRIEVPGVSSSNWPEQPLIELPKKDPRESGWRGSWIDPRPGHPRPPNPRWLNSKPAKSGDGSFTTKAVPVPPKRARPDSAKVGSSR